MDRMKKSTAAIRKLFLLVAFMLVLASLRAQEGHPHILVKPADRAAILEKINGQAWAKKVFDAMQSAVAPYVERHKTDPQWILSRYLMNRAPGKRYTRFYSDDDGTRLIRYEGDAPYPTVRVSPHKRPPITQDGSGYRMPSIEELVPNDTSMKMWLQRNAPDGRKEWVDPQSFVEGINGKINELVLDASIIYWLTGKPEYAVFAADVLNQWACGASYQSPIDGPCRTGFLSIQTLGDARYETLTLAYDFLYDFLRQKNYNTSWYEGVFEKIAAAMTFRGYWNNNWFAAQTPAKVFAALSLEKPGRRDYYLNFYLNKDTISGSCGHLSMGSVVDKWLTPDGHWKEPGGYHNFPVSSLLTSALALESNGYNVFGKYPALFKSSYVLLKYSFPNFSAPSIGDTGPVSQSPECLEIGIVMAKKYRNPVADQLVAAMEVMIRQKGYQRGNSDWLGLLCYLPEIPAANGVTYTWPRSGELDFAKCYLQRNGTDPQTGLMYVVQGATYNHNHANGMSLELYGAGTVMGPDPGKGLTYEAPMHVNYYAQWAAHNTVIAGGRSSSVPYFTGGGGAKNMGAIKLDAMEPLADQDAVSPFCSFTDTRYTDLSTDTKQQRTLAIIRTGERSGYYVDIYRSANPVSNEYLYHNIGDGLTLLNRDRTALAVKPDSVAMSRKPFDPPGLRMIEELRSAGPADSMTIALFRLKERQQFMQVMLAGGRDRKVYAGSGPQSGTADMPYRTMRTPTLICRQAGEAWKRPFLALYEPFTGQGNYTVQNMQAVEQSADGAFEALKVVNTDRSSQLILQSLDDDSHHAGDAELAGRFGLVSEKAGQPQYLYLGEGSLLSYRQYTLLTGSPNGAANVMMEEKTLLFSCNQETTLTIRRASVKSMHITDVSGTRALPFVRGKDGISVTVPAVKNARITLD